MMKYKPTGQITPIKDAEFKDRIREIHAAFFGNCDRRSGFLL